ncbi:MAG TPA: DUF192 domain-containing protein [Candidatus Elarobacter sp.]
MPLLRNSTTGKIVATRIDQLSTFLHRAVGLLARTTIRPDEGVWITSCRAIHTIGMRVAIDVIFVDDDGHVIRVVHNVKPNRVALSCPGARAVVELGSGALREVDVVPGDRLELV